MGYSIAVFGAFNVCSFGDTLFPVALHQELTKRITVDEFVIFSLGGAKADYLKKYTVHGYDKFEELNQKIDFDAIIIGGGELLHNRAITFEDGKIVYAPGEIWKVPIRLGKKYNIPVLINGVGMPYELEEKEREEYENLFCNLRYVSLRDRFSYERWKKFFGNSLHVELIPDTLWCIKDYFSNEKLNDEICKLKKRYNISEKYIILQYGTTKEYKEVVDIVKRFARANDLQLVLCAVNASHEDKYVVEHIAEEKDVVAIKDTLLPEEIVAVISRAQLFIGTSFHGNLAALAYGVRNIIVDMYPEFVSKLDGLSEMVGFSKNFVGEIQDLWYVLNDECILQSEIDECVQRLRLRIQEHFSRICRIIENPGDLSAGSIIKKEPEKELGEALFRKAYFKVYNSSGCIQIRKIIAERKEGVFTYTVPSYNYSEDDNVYFIMPIEKPLRVLLEHEWELIIDKNEIAENVYLAPILRWRLQNRPEYNLTCQYKDIDVSQYSDEILQSYKNLCLYNDQMLLKEREYFSAYNDQERDLDSLKAEKQKLENDIDADRQENGKLLSQIKQLDQQTDLLKETARDYQKEIIQLKQALLKKEENVSALLLAEKELDDIKKSKMFRIMQIGCKSIDIILFVPKWIGKQLYAFIRMMTHVNPQELKIAWGYVKNEGIAGAYRHLMRDYHQGELKKIQVDVEKKIFDEITDINLCEKIILPQFEKPQVSIVIPVYNQFTYTYYCIKSIVENSGDISYEVILADDCSDDLTTQITTVVENIVVAKTETNLRFLRNCNNAAKYAKGQYILFLNNDTQVQKDWLKPLVDLIERDATIGMVGSKLVYADGSLQEAGGIIWSDGSGWNYGRNDDAMKPEYNYVRDVDYISGAAIMIRKNLWEQLGGFDEHFAPAYCEDSDLAFMVRRAGYRVVYQPASVVVHFEGKSNGTDLNSGVKKYQVENSIKLRKKWEKELSEQYENAQCVFKARERSKNKKVILVIDHYVPQFDKDAGSKTTFQYLKMFVKQGYSVKFIGDNFYQDEPYTTVLQQMGVEVLYGSWYAQHWQEWILDNKKYIDFVYLNRPHITIKYIDFLKEKTDIKCVYYGHDLHFLRLRREYELTGDKEKLRESNEWLEKELYIMRRADISYYPSYIEEEEIHKIDPDIRVKAITAYVFESFLEKISRNFTKREGIMFVGGFGHPPNEDAVLWFAKEVYPLIEQRLKMPFYIVGSKPTEAVKRLSSENIIVKGFVSEEELAHLYNTCKIVVVPLRYGAGVKGKVVEALYYGAPMVTTSVGTEGIKGAEDIIEVEETPEKFADAVISLYTDDERLTKTVDAYQKFVKDHFSVEAVWDIIKDDFS